MFKKRFSALLLSFVLLLAVLCGCGEPEPSNPTLRIMSTLGSDADFEVYSSLLGEFAAAHSDIYLRDTTVAASEAYRLSAADENTYKSYDAPHVVYYAAAGCFDSLSEYFVSVEEIRESYPDFASGVDSRALDSFRLADGRVYCVPVAGEWTAIVINRAIFDQYSIPVPKDWSGLLSAVSSLSAAGVIPFANSADNCPAVIEQLVASYGGSQAVSLGLQGYSDIISDYWSGALSNFSDLCRSGAFAPAALSDDLLAALHAKYPVSATDVSASDIIAANLPESYDDILGEKRDRYVTADPFTLFNGGNAAMIIIDSSEFSNILLTENIQAISLPTQSGAAFSGGFRSGFAVTRRAFGDPLLRDAAVALADHMTNPAAAEKFASIGYLTANTQAQTSGIASSLSPSPAEGYTLSARGGSNAQRWNEIKSVCARLYYGLLTPQQAAAGLSDSSLIWYTEPVIEQPEVSASDITSDSDV